MHPAMSELAELPPAERLELVQALWDSIVASKHEMPIQDWHRTLAQARLNDFEEQGAEAGLTEEQVWQEVDQRRGS